MDAIRDISNALSREQSFKIHMASIQRYCTFEMVFNNGLRATLPKWAPKVMRPGPKKPALAGHWPIVKNHTESMHKLFVISIASCAVFDSIDRSIPFWNRARVLCVKTVL